jgi:two-component system, LuxR family, sensor kinase FixL
MTAVNIHGRPGQDQRPVTPLSAGFFGSRDPGSLKFWLTGIAFLILYSMLTRVAVYHQLEGLGITLWSPYNGLSLLMLIEGAIFAPFVVLGAVVTDVLVFRVNHSLFLTVTVELVLTVCYMCIAAVLRYKLAFNPRRVGLQDVIAFLSFVPGCTLLTSFSYCGVLYLGGALSADKFLMAMRHFWIGDTVGIITIISVATSVFTFLWKPSWHWSGYTFVSCSVFIVGTCVGFAVLIGEGDAKQYHIFYPLFLPIIWVGMREGYAGVAVALLVIQLGLVAVTNHLGCDVSDYNVFQTLMLVLSVTGLLLGAVTTERHASALLLREQQNELARMSAYVSAGAMGMALAHEISQPLSTMASYLHAARRMLQSAGVAGPVMDVLNKAEAESRRTRGVLERIREFVSSGKLALEELDITALAQKIVSLCREDAATRGIRVEIENADPIPLIRADRIQIEQVLNNLVANAIDAASERLDGRGRVIIHVATCGDKVVMQVEDNGPGVASEIADRMFKAYQTTKSGGMGLGLHLSMQFVEKHAGRLWWERDVSERTRFVVELPVEGPD